MYMGHHMGILYFFLHQRAINDQASLRIRLEPSLLEDDKGSD